MRAMNDDKHGTEVHKKIIELVVEEGYGKDRIDKYLSNMLENYTRSHLQKLIREGRVHIDNKPVKSNFRVATGQKVTLYLPEPLEARIVPEDIPLDIIYEDNDIIIINKQKGLVVHPAPGHLSGTLVNGLLYRYKEGLSTLNGALRPGIVHRIDKDTTGVLVVCKNDKAHLSIARQLKAHTITRRYQAIVYNILKEEKGRVEATIGRDPKNRKKMAAGVANGKPAATNYRLIENLGRRHAYVECELETGRTHQIRVHMASINHPILGDTIYSPGKNPFKLEGQALHAGVLGLIHPSTNEYVEFSAPLPGYFEDLLKRLR